MANPEHVSKLGEGVNAWNMWREIQAVAPDLSGIDFSGKDLSRSDLRGVNFTGSDLSGTSFREANLKDAILRGADLRRINFSGSTLTGASLREANLRGVDLSVANRGLQTEQLAGADLTGATLPEELKKLYDALGNVKDISESARKLFLGVLAACLYSWLTIAATTDLNLITNRSSSPLPIIQTSIPIVSFYAVAPLLLLCVYFYLHFYLQKLWEELGCLPAILPDGRPLHAKIDPWLLNDLVRSHLPKLNVNRPFMSYFQQLISFLLAWWVVPITMFLFWWRYLPRHGWAGTTLHVAFLALSVTAAVHLYRIARATLRGVERIPFRWRHLFRSPGTYRTASDAVLVGLLFGILSWGGIRGTPTSYYWTNPGDPRAWVPRSMSLIGYSPFADLQGAELSQRKPNWSKGDKNLDSVTGAQLRGANLQYASGRKAFLAGADLSESDLRGADLKGADLQGTDLIDADLRIADLQGGVNLEGADLRGARLDGAYLIGVRLNGARLNGAHLGHADLSSSILFEVDLAGADCGVRSLRGADLTYANFREAKNLSPEAVKSALHWDKAFYDADMLKALGLPIDQTARLEAQGAPRRPAPVTGLSVVQSETKAPLD